MFCRKCGANIPEGQLACGQCGATVAADSQAGAQELPADPYGDSAGSFAVGGQPASVPEPTAFPSHPPPVAAMPEQQAPTQPEQVIYPEALPYAPAVAPERPKKRVNVKLLLIAAGVVIALAATTGLLVRHNNNVKEAKAAANTVIGEAKASIEKAGFAVEPDTDEVAEYAKATDTIEQAQASFAEGGFFKPSAFRQAADLAAKAEDEAEVILTRVDKLISDASALGRDGNTEDAFEAYFALAERYPRAVGVSAALDDAEELLMSQTAEGTVWVSRDEAKRDLKLMRVFLRGYPGEEKPTAVIERAKTRLLTEAGDCVSACESAMNANRTWSNQMLKRGKTSGLVAVNFKDQSVDGSDMKYVQDLKALLSGLEQPGDMAKLLTLLVDSSRLNNECRAIANKPVRKKITSTSDERWYSPNQVNKVKANAARLASKISAAKKLLVGMKGV